MSIYTRDIFYGLKNCWLTFFLNYEWEYYIIYRNCVLSHLELTQSYIFSFHFRAIFHPSFHSLFFPHTRISFATAERLRQRIYIQLFHGTSDLFWMWRPAPRIADRYEDEAEKERDRRRGKMRKSNRRYLGPVSEGSRSSRTLLKIYFYRSSREQFMLTKCRLSWARARFSVIIFKEI